MSSLENIIIRIAVIVIIIVIAKAMSRSKKHNSITNTTINTNPTNAESQIISRIKQVDPQFNSTEFKAYAKDVFIKLQNAWTERDWEKIRPFETNELFEMHKAQLDGYIKNNQINVMERICVNAVYYTDFEQNGGKDIIKVDLYSRMGDYIIDATTRQVIRGSKSAEYYHTYTLTFVRKTGNKTKVGDNNLNTTNCPNCGAPTTITSSGRCEYCNSVITTEDHGWALSSLTRKK